VPAGPAGRLLVLAESSDSRWRAEIGGTRLRPVQAWAWAQAFELPASGGDVHIWHAAGHRRMSLAIEGALVAIVVLAAWPAARRQSDDYDVPLPPPVVEEPREPLGVGATAASQGRPQ
jgi:hypothetical protein